MPEVPFGRRNALTDAHAVGPRAHYPEISGVVGLSGVCGADCQ